MQNRSRREALALLAPPAPRRGRLAARRARDRAPCAAGRSPRASAPASTTSRPRPTAASGSRRSAAATSAGSIRRAARVELVALGGGSSPHGVIQGPDKAAWLTDGGQNAIVRVGWPDRAVRVFPLPAGTPLREPQHRDLRRRRRPLVHRPERRRRQGRDQDAAASRSRTRRAAPAPTASARRRAATSGGARSPARSSPASTARAANRRSSSRRRRSQGARRVWSDSQGRIWVSEWLSGNVSMHDPAEGELAHLEAAGRERRGRTRSTSTIATRSG